MRTGSPAFNKILYVNCNSDQATYKILIISCAERYVILQLVPCQNINVAPDE